MQNNFSPRSKTGKYQIRLMKTRSVHISYEYANSAHFFTNFQDSFVLSITRGFWSLFVALDCWKEYPLAVLLISVVFSLASLHFHCLFNRCVVSTSFSTLFNRISIVQAVGIATGERRTGASLWKTDDTLWIAVRSVPEPYQCPVTYLIMMLLFTAFLQYFRNIILWKYCLKQVLIPLNEMDAGSPFSKSFKSARVPYRRVTKVRFLGVIAVYAFGQSAVPQSHSHLHLKHISKHCNARAREKVARLCAYHY